MKIIANGYNASLDILEDDIVKLDGLKLTSLDLVIINITTREEIEKLVRDLSIIKYSLNP